MSIAYLFNGQGAESPAMGINFYQNSLIFKQVIDTANSELDFDLVTYLTTETPWLPEHVQPALVAYSVALYQAVQTQLPPAKALIGLSLGEYSALIASGMLGLKSGLQLVVRRGELMTQAAKQVESGMLAVMTTDQATVETLCQRIGQVWPANYNTPKQLVVGGQQEALNHLQAALLEQGIKSIPLPVAGSFHTPLMASVVAPLQEALDATEFQPGRVPVLSTTQNTRFTPANVRAILAAQVAQPTHFVDGLMRLQQQGVDTTIELGQPKLVKMVKQSRLGFTTASIAESIDLTNLIKQSEETHGIKG